MRDSRTKSFQNPSKTFPKRSQNPPKTLPKSSQNPSRTPLQNGTREKINFFGFCSIFGGPGASPNRPKIAKNLKKNWKNRNWKNTSFLIPRFSNFLHFGLRKRSQNQGFFVTFSKTSILRKSCSRRGEIAIFHVSSFRKTIKNRCQHRPRKKHRKNPSKIDFPFQVGFPKPPKILENGPPKRCKTKLV